MVVAGEPLAVPVRDAGLRRVDPDAGTTDSASASSSSQAFAQASESSR
jgi:hypothetical protein